MKILSWLLTIGLFGWLGFAPLMADAHPHVWVNYYVKAIAGKDGITKLRFTWDFDTMFTEMVQDEFKLREIGEKDSKFIKSHAFDNLKNYHFYMDLKADGQPFEPPDVSAFVSRMKGKAMEYQFTVTLPKPAQTVELSLYDPEFYVDIEPPMQEVESDHAGQSMLAVAHYKPKDFMSAAGEDGAPAPLCSGHDGKARESVWGEFPVYVVTCKVGT